MDRHDTMHEFHLVHVPGPQHAAPFGDPFYNTIMTSPPAGCVPESMDGYFSLRCCRAAPTLLEAVVEVCVEVQAAHGFLLNDLGIEKLWEFSGGGTNGSGAKITIQLMLMFLERGLVLGYTGAELVTALSALASVPAAGTQSDNSH